MEETKRFYERLGFRAVCYLESEQPHICLYRDSIEFILTKSKLESITPTRETHGYGYDAYLISTEQEEFFETVRANGVRVIRELDLTDYRNREFIFEDNERRWIAVGCKVGSSEVEGMRPEHVAFSCRDIRAMERFYTDKLGFSRERVFREGQSDEFFILGRDGVRVELFPAKDDTSRGDARFRHYAIGVRSLDSAMAMLKEQGIAIDRYIDHSSEAEVFRVCFFSDPEGNSIEFMERYPR
jgi:catechol 2,3-dioxygenase-like lactoylglutathione lyase family enzyme